jgi:hypothetical protein
MTKRYSLLSFVPAFLGLAVIGTMDATLQDATEDLSVWKTQGTPEPGTDTWGKANISHKEWQVFAKDGKMMARPYDARSPQTVQLPFGFVPQPIAAAPKVALGKPMRVPQDKTVRVEDGWLIGRNSGEWGGNIYWYSPDGRKQQKVSSEQPVRFLKTKRFGLVAIQGLAHGGMSRGGIVRLMKKQGRWVSQPVVDLRDAPYAVLEEADGSLLVVTSDQLLRVHPDKTVQKLLTKMFWRGLYPNSLQSTSTGDLYVGMRQGVARLVPKDGDRDKYKMEWLTPE